MILVVKLIGILMACVGVANILNPNIMKKMLAFWRKGKNIYIGGLLRITFGVIFMISAPQASRMPLVIYFLGILMILGGTIIFIMGLEKVKTVLDWWGKKPHSVLRLVGLLVFALGALIIYSA